MNKNSFLKSKSISMNDQQAQNAELFLTKQKYCLVCSKKYTIFDNEHHCKRCFRSICKDCGSHKRIIIGYTVKPNKPHKICQYCENDSYFIHDIIQNNKLKWGHSSVIGKKWVKKCKFYKENSENFEEKSKTHYFTGYNKIIDYLDRKQNGIKKNRIQDLNLKLMDECFYDINKFQQIVENGEQNYSYTEFFYYVQKNVNSSQPPADVKGVILALLGNNCDLGFCIEMVHIVTFLLCFVNQYNALVIIEDIYLNQLPQFMHPLYTQILIYDEDQKDVQYEKLANYQIQCLDVLKTQLNIQLNVLPKVKVFFQKWGLSYLQMYGIQKLRFLEGFKLFSYCFESEYPFKELTQRLINLTYLNIDTIKILGPENDLIQQEIMDHTNLYNIEPEQNILNLDSIFNKQSNHNNCEQNNLNLKNLEEEIQNLKQENEKLKLKENDLRRQLGIEDSDITESNLSTQSQNESNGSLGNGKKTDKNGMQKSQKLSELQNQSIKLNEILDKLKHKQIINQSNIQKDNNQKSQDNLQIEQLQSQFQNEKQEVENLENYIKELEFNLENLKIEVKREKSKFKQNLQLKKKNQKKIMKQQFQQRSKTTRLSLQQNINIHNFDEISSSSGSDSDNQKSDNQKNSEIKNKKEEDQEEEKNEENEELLKILQNLKQIVENQKIEIEQETQAKEELLQENISLQIKLEKAQKNEQELEGQEEEQGQLQKYQQILKEKQELLCKLEIEIENQKNKRDSLQIKQQKDIKQKIQQSNIDQKQENLQIKEEQEEEEKNNDINIKQQQKQNNIEEVNKNDINENEINNVNNEQQNSQNK